MKEKPSVFLFAARRFVRNGQLDEDLVQSRLQIAFFKIGSSLGPSVYSDRKKRYVLLLRSRLPVKSKLIG